MNQTITIFNHLGKAIETAEGDLTPSAFGKILSKTMGPNKFCRRHPQQVDMRRDDTKAGVVSSLLLGRLRLTMLKAPQRQLTKSNPRRCRKISNPRHIEQISQIPHRRIRFSGRVRA